MRWVLVFLVLLTAACGNRNADLHIGDFSLGQQLIDLKAARDAGAIDSEEYEEARSRMLTMADLCGDLD